MSLHLFQYLFQYLFRSTTLLLFLFFVPGACFKIQKETPTKHRFALQISRPKSFAPKPKSDFKSKGSLLVRRMQIAPSFLSKNFIYKVSDNEFESDYYNEFLVLPESNIRTATSRWFDLSPLFTRVIASSSRLQADYILESNIYLLYGDFSTETPVAVMEIKFTLIEKKGPTPLMEKIYKEKIKIPGKNAPALAVGYKKCLTNILMSLEEDIFLAFQKNSL